LFVVAAGLIVILLVALPGGHRTTTAPASPSSVNGGGTGGPAAPRASERKLPKATVVLASSVGGARVPRSFFGLSAEYPELSIYERHAALFERVLSLLSRDGPLVLRIGGDSADRT
jgi:hypothetical protein